LIAAGIDSDKNVTWQHREFNLLADNQRLTLIYE
jgi:hypothetical protein